MNGLPYALEQFLLSFSLMDIELHVDKSFSISFSNTHTCEHTRTCVIDIYSMNSCINSLVTRLS